MAERNEQPSSDEIARAIHQQTAAINLLANSIAMLASALAEDADEDLGPQYLDGSGAQ